jgi:hypothetical protein
MRELLLTGIAAAILLVTVTIWWMLRRRRRTKLEVKKAANTLDVIPLPAPPVLPPRVAAPKPLPSPRVIVDDDIEGRTVPAQMSSEEAYEMHARYAPAFDQQLAVARYVERHGDVDAPAGENDTPDFDQQRYLTALQYAEAFEHQLATQRRTQVYAAIAGPRRIARGSYTPQQYQAQTKRSDHSDPSQWENKTIVGVKPLKPAK